ncbi:MAG: N-acetyl sugar amidotransferase [Verrucomicrobiae bacterium]|nr:N-acetyl sugar amidotransferase [Verrucomicrobiae bacterium]
MALTGRYLPSIPTRTNLRICFLNHKPVSEYRICSKCVMDTSDPDISFDAEGVCNHCHYYDAISETHLHYDDEGQQRIAEIVKQIKDSGRKKRYDCISGISGGVDSSYTAFLAKKLGLRPLIVHFDNGWNSETAVQNVYKLVSNLGFDMETYVVDWDEFKDIQLAYLKAGVMDIEAPTDHAIAAVVNRLTRQYKIKYLLSGGNIVTEAILPNAWGYSNMDLRNILAIHERYGTVKLKSFPTFGLVDRIWFQIIHGIQSVRLLNYVHYDRKEAKEILSRELGWQDYGGKHYESVITRFYQGYLLPKKFGIDKRRAHFSTMICSGQMTRDESLRELESPPYPTEALLQEDMEFVAKKFGLSLRGFQEIVESPPRSHYDFPNNQNLYKRLKKMAALVFRGRNLGSN